MSEKRKPCRECPFSKSIAPDNPHGTLGGGNPLTYIGQAQGAFLLSCHMDPKYAENPRSANLTQCAGAAIYRANIGVASRMPEQLLALPADPDLAFTSAKEFLVHHSGGDDPVIDALLAAMPPDMLLAIEMRRSGTLPVDFNDG